MIKSTAMDARSVVESLIACWATQDVEMTMAHISEEAVYSLYLSEETVPFGGVSQGKEHIRATLYMMLAEFDYLRFDREIVGVEGDVVKVQTQFKFHHRRTGGNLEGSMRTVFTVADGLVVRCDEYLDEGLVETFMRLTRQREADNEIVPPPQIPRPERRTPHEPAVSTERKEPQE